MGNIDFIRKLRGCHNEELQSPIITITFYQWLQPKPFLIFYILVFFLLFFKMRVAAALFFKWKTGISKHYPFDGALIVMGPHSGNHVCISFVQLCVRLFLPKMGPFGIRFTWTHRHRQPTDDIYFVVAVKSTDYTQRSSFAICIPAAQSF